MLVESIHHVAVKEFTVNAAFSLSCIERMVVLLPVLLNWFTPLFTRRLPSHDWNIRQTRRSECRGVVCECRYCFSAEGRFRQGDAVRGSRRGGVQDRRYRSRPLYRSSNITDVAGSRGTAHDQGSDSIKRGHYWLCLRSGSGSSQLPADGVIEIARHSEERSCLAL